ncbi:chloroplastic group IIA intron splicing facilitator CRS1, chloroplastic [Rhodamnia argentea]|uniref:Chloroplastic group IIA intron splicing facilitator CRS1, chloroplastic n=1 Tax=Rhodamnia argentea TaxID=178133 RepID=A0A8B8NQL4_9MYRT|nr:chloroplastic group IIA intron splicing facilitator CRS1, chloroplastic [Rhodamnia argentea]XP_048130845.1 chloroplastic group IIA intron splicing facilitator CRS1, chloroplastic [Rhodamnia argentea]XP_048130846.1 chloroplastic group IIA intron splicing facilitator CRS1, chloroplastic [Rhodamnia argentea]
MAATLYLSPSALPNNSRFRASSSPSATSSSRVTAENLPMKSPDFSVSIDPIARPNGPVKMPTAPWMRGPLLVPPGEVLDLSRPRSSNRGSGDRKPKKLDRASGVRGNKAVQKIVQSIEKLRGRSHSDGAGKESGEIEFGICLESLKEEEEEGAKPGFVGKMPWVREGERVVFRRTKTEKAANVAELSLEKELLDRLRKEAAKLRKWVKVKKIGVSQAVVDEIKWTWRRNELAMVKFDVPLCRNMDRAQEILEMKTGSLVIWRKKDTLVLYRGVHYPYNVFQEKERIPAIGQERLPFFCMQSNPKRVMSITPVKDSHRILDEKTKGEDGQRHSGAISRDYKACSESINGSLYERETDRLLDGLGPRFVDWWMRKPLPVDADLLPEVVPGFSPPLRLCPPNERPKLTDNELTYLRKLAHPLPTHFVLGRNRKLQGLAAAIMKLWEKSLIAKIAVKWGVPNTNNEQMAYELKGLTGGILLLRNKFYIILYRGKDFLPQTLTSSIAKRELELRKCQVVEEDARIKAFERLAVANEPLAKTCTMGTLSEFVKIQTDFQEQRRGVGEVNVRLVAEIERLEKELRKEERRRFILNSKMRRSAKQLSKLNSGWRPAEKDTDQEMMTEEDKECLRKIGLKMDGSLLLGRRGVFDGVIEAMHQHWKHREVVKVISMQRSYPQVIGTAKLLEAETGGILVSVDKLKDGHCIIIYRGKNYKRPVKLSTEHLLTKRKALLRSLEMQRFGSLKFFTSQKQRKISDLQLKRAELKDHLGQ